MQWGYTTRISYVYLIHVGYIQIWQVPDPVDESKEIDCWLLGIRASPEYKCIHVDLGGLAWVCGESWLAVKYRLFKPPPQFSPEYPVGLILFLSPCALYGVQVGITFSFFPLCTYICDPTVTDPAETCDCTSAENTAAIIGGAVVAVALILSVCLTVIIVIVLNHRGNCSTKTKKRYCIHPNRC